MFYYLTWRTHAGALKMLSSIRDVYTHAAPDPPGSAAQVKRKPSPPPVKVEGSDSSSDDDSVEDPAD
jgi:hypothetical protein